MEEPLLSFVHISDTHLAEDATFNLPGLTHSPQAGAEALLALDSSRPPSPAGELGTQQREWLSERCATADARPLVVALHHNPFQTPPSPWWDAMSLRDGEDFHQALLPARERLRGVFFGHIHQPLQYYRDGILYSAVNGSWESLHYYPHAEDFQIDTESLPSFNLVHIGARTTTIRRHSFQVSITHDE